jgi:hypothetical protein
MRHLALRGLHVAGARVDVEIDFATGRPIVRTEGFPSGWVVR